MAVFVTKNQQNFRLSATLLQSLIRFLFSQYVENCYVAGDDVIAWHSPVILPWTNTLILEKPDSGRGMLLVCKFTKSNAVASSQATMSALQIIAVCDIET